MTASTLRVCVSPTGLRYAHVDVEGRVTVIGYGATMMQAFEAAAAAMFDLTTDLELVHPHRTVPVSFVASEAEAALVRWLNVLLEAARHHGLAFSEFHLLREGNSWRGSATGDVHRERPGHDLEVMRVHSDMLTVHQTPEGWEARCAVECQPRVPPRRIAREDGNPSDAVDGH